MENFTKVNAMMMLTQFDAIICAKHNIQSIKQMENYDFVLKDANEKITKKTTDNVIKSNKCNQCDCASSLALHFTPVSESLSQWAEFRTSVAPRLASLLQYDEKF